MNKLASTALYKKKKTIHEGVERTSKYICEAICLFNELIHWKSFIFIFVTTQQ